VGDVRIGIHVKHKPGDIPSIIANIRSNSAAASYGFARGTAAQARFLAPVDTGFLKSSIINRKVAPYHHKVRVGAHYGVYVEYGTRHMAAQPYFRPAIEMQKAIFRRQMARVFD
jgi:HK97 gp10 family phage protein